MASEGSQHFKKSPSVMNISGNNKEQSARCVDVGDNDEFWESTRMMRWVT